MLAWNYETEVNIFIWIMVISSIIYLIQDTYKDKKKK